MVICFCCCTDTVTDRVQNICCYKEIVERKISELKSAEMGSLKDFSLSRQKARTQLCQLLLHLVCIWDIELELGPVIRERHDLVPHLVHIRPKALLHLFAHFS